MNKIKLKARYTPSCGEQKKQDFETVGLAENLKKYTLRIIRNILKILFSQAHWQYLALIHSLTNCWSISCTKILFIIKTNYNSPAVRVQSCLLYLCSSLEYCSKLGSFYVKHIAADSRVDWTTSLILNVTEYPPECILLLVIFRFAINILWCSCAGTELS